jgi:hypothetical protein
MLIRYGKNFKKNMRNGGLKWSTENRNDLVQVIQRNCKSMGIEVQL